MIGAPKTTEDKKGPVPGAPAGEAGKPGGNKYVPPSLREGAVKRAKNLAMKRRVDQTYIRISNLSNSTTESDLEDLVKPFGPIQKLYLAKDKSSGDCKGFAYIHFKFRNDASRAITTLNGYGYHHLILNVDWSKPPTHSNQ